MNVEVLSFERMAYRVIRETIPGKLNLLDTSEKAMIIEDALERHQKELNFLGKNSENVDLILKQITEFKKHNISLDSLKSQIDNTKNKYIQAKLNDIYILYKDLEEKIEGIFVDENDILNILKENLEKSHIFDNALFFIDEFSGFTKQEYSIIEILDKIAKDLYITVCTDELKITASPELDVFYDNKQTIQSLSKINDFDKENQIRLTDSHRFKNSELLHLERNIYAPKYEKYENEVSNIHLAELDNRYVETEYIASNILKLVRDENYRFQDIAIITNSLDEYKSLIKAIFNEYEIPFFIDDKKDITQNILIKYIVSILDILSKGWSYESVMNYVKTGLLEIDNIYELENYCLKWGIKNSKWYQSKWDYEDENNFNDEQEKITKPLLNLKNSFDGKKTAKEIATNLYNFLNENLISKRESNDTIKTIFEKEENIEAWNIIISTLEKIVKIFGNENITFERFQKLFTTCISFEEFSKIPETQDKVIIGDVNHSRTHKIKAIFIMGVNDGAFPKVVTSEGFLNDKDRETLKEDNFELAKTSLEKLYEENFNIYKAFSTAEEKIFVTYSANNSKGESMRRALIVTKLMRIFPTLTLEKELKDEVLTKKITFSKLLNNLDNPDWVSVFKWFNEYNKNDLDKALSGLDFTNIPENITLDNAEKLYGNHLKTSVSKLEQYSACAFSYYLKYGLKLSEKEKLNITPLDTGTFMHNAIDEFFKVSLEKASSKNVSIKDLSEDEIKEIIEKIVDDQTKISLKFNTTAKYRNTVRRLKEVILDSIKYILDSLRYSSFEILGTEISFGGAPEANDSIIDNQKSYPEISVDLDNNKKISITGKIDRVDIAHLPDGDYIRIIDYKSSKNTINFSKIKAGMQLQLLTYAKAVSENENAKVAGILYYELKEPTKGNSNEKESHKMEGLVVHDVEIVKEMDFNLKEDDIKTSDIIPVKFNKDGTIQKGSGTVSEKEFIALQNYTEKLIKTLSEEILSGKITLNPYFLESSKGKAHTPCEYCDYKSICQFNTSLPNNKYNYIPSQSKDEILEEIRNIKADD